MYSSVSLTTKFSLIFFRFSHIENMFGFTKQKLKEFIFTNKEALASKIKDLMFSYDTARMMRFYRKTLSNMLEFWTKLDRDAFLMMIFE